MENHECWERKVHHKRFCNATLLIQNVSELFANSKSRLIYSLFPIYISLRVEHIFSWLYSGTITKLKNILAGFGVPIKNGYRTIYNILYSSDMIRVFKLIYSIIFSKSIFLQKQ